MRDEKGRFLKGIIPWNKGVPQSVQAKEKNSKAHLGNTAWNKGIPQSAESRRKMSESHKKLKLSKEHKINISKSLKGINVGEKSHFWQGGITPLRFQIKNNFMYRQWRSDVFTRDDFTCQECGQLGGKLNAHHIKSYSSLIQFYEITTLEEALNCDELWNINNGITLCRKCHKKLHRRLKRGNHA